MTSRGKVYLRRHLMLSKEYAQLLLSGAKKATIRLGVVIPKYDEVIIHSGGRPIAKARIVGVTYKRVSELTDEDAKLDGFDNVDELIKALRRTYRRISGNDVVSIVRLEVVQRLDELKTDDVYYGLNPSDVARIGLRYLRDELGEEDARILELLGRGLSIRKVASILYGSPLRRLKIRRVLRRALRELVRREIVAPREGEKRDTQG